MTCSADSQRFIDRMVVAMSALLLLRTPQGMPVVMATEIGVEMTGEERIIGPW